LPSLPSLTSFRNKTSSNRVSTWVVVMILLMGGLMRVMCIRLLRCA
jgi:hypothetical protein